MYPVPTIENLAYFSGRPETSYTGFAVAALAQATLMFTFRTEITDPSQFTGYNNITPADATQLATTGICAMADYLYLRQPYQQAIASPMQSETVGSYCVDEETEILTAAGWRDFRSLRQGDEVLTLNPGTWQTEWQPCLEACVFPPRLREMFRMESRRLSALTTLDHRWVSRPQSGKVRWTTSQQLNSKDQIPCAAPYGDVLAEPKYSDALVEAVAWFWTEGSWNWRGRTRSVTIHQSHRANPGKCDRIRAALTRLFGPDAGSVGGFISDSDANPVCECGKQARNRGRCPSCYMKYWRSSAFERSARRADWTERVSGGRPGMSSFVLSAPASEAVTRHVTISPGGAKAVSTEFLRSLTQAQLELFVHVSLLADGTFAGSNRNVPQLAQRDKLAAEQFALACILAGRRVSFRQLQSGMWQVTLIRSSEHRPWNAAYLSGSACLDRVVYGGHVWCPRTDNQTWLARRNGTIYFTGNTYSKPYAQMARNAAALEVQGEETGVVLYDLAVQMLSLRTLAGGVYSGSVQLFERPRDRDDKAQLRVCRDQETGQLYVRGPADIDQIDFQFFDINAENFPVDPGLG